MKKISFLAITLLLTLVGVSCTPKEDSTPEAPTLTLSTNSVVFTKDAQNPTAPQVTIKTNQESWYAMTSADWLELKRNGEGLLIVASENTKGIERKANVYVQVSGKQEVVEVTQSSADIILDFTPEEVVLPRTGGDKIILVKSNVDTWTLEEVDDELKTWLTITANEEKGIILLTATENNTPDAREGKIFAKSDRGGSKELMIKQEGIAQYFLPWYEKEFNSYNLIKFEQERGTILTSHTDASEGWMGSTPGSFTFVTNSEKFPSYAYIYYLNSATSYDACYMLCTDVNELSEDGGFINWLLTQGYSKRDNSTADEPRYENEDHSMFMSIKWIKDEDSGEALGAQVIFTPQVIQDKPMPSFSQLPTGPAGFLSNIRNKGVKPSDVKAFEGKNKGVLTPGGEIFNPTEGYKNELFYMVYDVSGATKDYDAITRFYQFYIHFQNPDFLKPSSEDLYQSIAYGYLGFNELDRGLFFVDEGQFKITAELQALLKENGYKFVKIGTGGDAGFIYYNATDKMVLTIQLWTDPLVNGGNQTLVFRYHPEEMSVPSFVKMGANTFEDFKKGNLNESDIREIFQPTIATGKLSHNTPFILNK